MSHDFRISCADVYYEQGSKEDVLHPTSYPTNSEARKINQDSFLQRGINCGLFPDGTEKDRTRTYKS